MTYPASAAPSVHVDPEGLAHLANKINETGSSKIALVGFGECAKHLVNLFGDRITVIYDDRPLFKGKNIRFRGVPCASADQTFDVDLILGCEYGLIYDYMGRIVKKYDWMRSYYPPRLNYKNTVQINPFEQDTLYQGALRDSDEAPPSMMVKEKIYFLLELLRTGLETGPGGSVIEMGSWQGGSAWFIAKALREMREERPFYMLDLFETHQIDPTATMCTDEIRTRMADAYARTEIFVGLVDDPKLLAKVKTPICFAHIDLGNVDDAIKFVWDNLLPGCPLLLDNYGHLLATWRFDDFFLSRKRIIRLPWSEQGFVFK